MWKIKRFEQEFLFLIPLNSMFLFLQDYDTVLQATVRILGIWLSQEPVALKNEIQSRLFKWMQYG